MSNKIIKSYWGVELSPRFIDAGSKKLLHNITWNRILFR